MPNTTYASRGRQRNFEATRKDDLESWTYCVSDREMILKRSKINFEVAEIFHKKLMPWNPDQKYLSENAAHKDSLHHKRAFCQGKCMFELKEWKMNELLQYGMHRRKFYLKNSEGFSLFSRLVIVMSHWVILSIRKWKQLPILHMNQSGLFSARQPNTMIFPSSDSLHGANLIEYDLWSLTHVFIPSLFRVQQWRHLLWKWQLNHVPSKISYLPFHEEYLVIILIP